TKPSCPPGSGSAVSRSYSPGTSTAEGVGGGAGEHRSGARLPLTVIVSTSRICRYWFRYAATFTGDIDVSQAVLIPAAEPLPGQEEDIVTVAACIEQVRRIGRESARNKRHL